MGFSPTQSFTESETPNLWSHHDSAPTTSIPLSLLHHRFDLQTATAGHRILRVKPLGCLTVGRRIFRDNGIARYCEVQILILGLVLFVRVQNQAPYLTVLYELRLRDRASRVDLSVKTIAWAVALGVHGLLVGNLRESLDEQTRVRSMAVYELL